MYAIELTGGKHPPSSAVLPIEWLEDGRSSEGGVGTCIAAATWEEATEGATGVPRLRDKSGSRVGTRV